ncbi:MAG TPA: tetratricopeptide repeat protein [Blastocatellia bacterium]|nr:tetratricopeptide repeat protein [Blastocatellia bacterium]
MFIFYRMSAAVKRVAVARSARLTVVIVLLLGPYKGAAGQDAQAGSIISRLEKATELIGRGELSPAESILNGILVETPRDANALNLLGVVRARQQRPADAERLFRRALAASPTHLGAHVNLAELLLTTNRSALALPVLLSAHRLAPERPDINLKLAMVYSDARQYARAFEHLKLMQHRSAGPEFFQLLLKVLVELNRLEDARTLAVEYRKLNIGTGEDQARFAMLLADHGLADDAVELLEASRARSRESFYLLYALGVIQAALKRYDKAEDALTAALRDRPDDVPALRALSRVSRATGNFEKSLAHLVHARRVAPQSTDLLYDFGVTALEMDLLVDALEAFEGLRRLNPREPAYVYALAATELRKGDEAEAARLMKMYVEVRPKDAAGFYLLGAALRGLKQFAEARTALERSVRLKADPDVEYLLAETIYEQGNHTAAIAMLEGLIRTQPDHAAAQSLLGIAYRSQGNEAAARTALERAVQLNSKDLRAYYQLGLIYSKAGDKEAAKRMFDQADQLRGEQRNQQSVILKLIPPPQN